MSYNNPYQLETPFEESYELDEGSSAIGAEGHDFVGFMNKISQINRDLDKYDHTIDQVDSLHKRLLTEVNEEQASHLRHSLDNFVAQATDLQFKLKNEIKSAQRDGIHDTNKQAQAENSRQRFLKLIQDYRIVDSNYKEENKEQAKRQYMIIQPEATEDEVEAAISDVGGQQIFSQALLNANRRGKPRLLLRKSRQGTKSY